MIVEYNVYMVDQQNVFLIVIFITLVENKKQSGRNLCYQISS